MNIDQIIKISSELYIGRTCHPERRLLEHYEQSGRPFLGIVKWICGRSEIKKYEMNLISVMRDRTAKVSNVDDDESRGSVSGHWNCLYVSFALKRGASEPSSESILKLDNEDRLWPDKGISAKNIVIIKSGIPPNGASKILDGYINSRSYIRPTR